MLGVCAAICAPYGEITSRPALRDGSRSLRNAMEMRDSVHAHSRRRMESRVACSAHPHQLWGAALSSVRRTRLQHASHLLRQRKPEEKTADVGVVVDIDAPAAQVRETLRRQMWSMTKR